jgi:hypothetical protein
MNFCLIAEELSGTNADYDIFEPSRMQKALKCSRMCRRQWSLFQSKLGTAFFIMTPKRPAEVINAISISGKSCRRF